MHKLKYATCGSDINNQNIRQRDPVTANEIIE